MGSIHEPNTLDSTTPTSPDARAGRDTRATKGVTSKPDYSRLTQDEIVRLFNLHQNGLTQTQIAQTLGCSQRVVSQWVRNLTDTTEPAKLYLRGKALRMAENIVKKGLPRDHVAALKGLRVLEEEAKTAPISLTINGLVLGGMTFASQTSAVSAPLHRLTGNIESDNGDYVGTSEPGPSEVGK